MPGKLEKYTKEAGKFSCKAWRSGFFSTKTTVPKPSCFRRGRWLVKWVWSPSGRAFGFERWIQMETPRSTQPGKGWIVAQKQLGWRWCILLILPFSLGDGKFSAVILVKKGTRVFFFWSPFWVTQMDVNVNTKSSFFVGKTFWKKFHQTTGDVSKELRVTK